MEISSIYFKKVGVKKFRNLVNRRIAKFESNLTGKIPPDFKKHVEELESLVEYLIKEEILFDASDLYSYLDKNYNSFPLYHSYKFPKEQGRVKICNI